MWILVDKAGALSAFGHVHVITAGALRGFALLNCAGVPAQDLRFPVRALRVDAPAARSALGGEYARVKLGAEQRAATHRHMLGRPVLDAAEHPWVSLTIFLPAATSANGAIIARIRLRGGTRYTPGCLPGPLSAGGRFTAGKRMRRSRR